MAQQVKFYSVSSLPASTNTGGVYFVDNGELYKGSQRFGLGRVTVSESTTGITGARGDIVVTGSGAGWVFDGTNWQSLGGDIASLQSMWQSDIKSWTAGLVSSQQVDGTYIKQITKDADGKVSAVVSTFATDVQTAVGDNTVSGSNNGVTVTVTTTSGKVTAVGVTAPETKTWESMYSGGEGFYIYEVGQDTSGAVTASAKEFPALGTGTADGTVKLGAGADAKVSGWDTVKTDISNLQAVVSYSGTGTKAVTASTVTADTGTFTNLTVTDTATFSVTNVSASSLTVNGSTIEQIADSRIAAIASVTQTGASNGITVSVTTKAGSVTAVSVDATAFGNVMSFKGVVTALPSEGNKSGDIVVIGANPTGAGLVQGQEYIYSNDDWELIGDQNTYAVNAYSSTATVYNGVATVPTALNAVGAAADTFKSTLDAKVTTATGVSDTNKASNLVTAGAVAGYVAQEIGELGRAASKDFADTLTATGTALPTESAVASYVSTVVSGLDATPTDAGTQGVSVAVVEADGIITGVTTTVTKATLNTTLGTTNVADKTVATTIGATGVDTALATEKAVRDAITAAELVWLDASGAVIE